MIVDARIAHDRCLGTPNRDPHGSRPPDADHGPACGVTGRAAPVIRPESNREPAVGIGEARRGDGGLATRGGEQHAWAADEP
jgi:hypothetical protein